MDGLKLWYILEGYKKDELVSLCKALNYAGYSKLKKRELAGCIAEILLEPKIMICRLACLTEKALAFFDRAVERDYLEVANFSEDDFVSVDIISDTRYTCFDAKKERFYVPDDVKSVYKTFRNDKEFKDLQQEISWLLVCIKLSTYIYGVVPEEILMQLYARNTKLEGTSKDGMFNFLLIPNDILYSYYSFMDEDILSKYKCVYISDTCSDDYKYLVKEQGNKNFYIPTYEEILDFAEHIYLKNSDSATALWKLLKEEYGAGPKQRFLYMSDIWCQLALGETPQNVLKELLDRSEIQTDRAGIEKLIRLMFELSNNTRMIANRGYTPAEMHKIEQDKLKPIPYPKQVMPVIPFGAGPIKTSPRISRNSLCPCGSGKKYKRCCGKS